jgi:hypothetical protein
MIASRKIPIKSLSLRNDAELGISWERFESLNLDSLLRMNSCNLEDWEVVYFWDLALKSKRQRLTLGFIHNFELPETALFTHELLQQAETIVFYARE